MSTFFNKVVSNSSWNGLGSMGRAALNLLFAGVTIRWLGAADAGFVLAILAFTEVYASTTNLGFAPATVRYLSQMSQGWDTKVARKLLGTAVTMSAVFGVLLTVILWHGSPWLIIWAKHQGDHTPVQWFCGLMGIATLCKSVAYSLSACMEARQRFALLTKRSL